MPGLQCDHRTCASGNRYLCDLALRHEEHIRAQTVDRSHAAHQSTEDDLEFIERVAMKKRNFIILSILLFMGWILYRLFRIDLLVYRAYLTNNTKGKREDVHGRSYRYVYARFGHDLMVRDFKTGNSWFVR